MFFCGGRGWGFVGMELSCCVWVGFAVYLMLILSEVDDEL